MKHLLLSLATTLMAHAAVAQQPCVLNDVTDIDRCIQRGEPWEFDFGKTTVPNRYRVNVTANNDTQEQVIEDYFFISDSVVDIARGESKLVEMWMHSTIPFYLAQCSITLPKGLHFEPVNGSEPDARHDLYCYSKLDSLGSKYWEYKNGNDTMPNYTAPSYNLADYSLRRVVGYNDIGTLSSWEEKPWVATISTNFLQAGLDLYEFIFWNDIKVHYFGDGDYRVFHFKIIADDTFNGGIISIGYPEEDIHGYSLKVIHEPSDGSNPSFISYIRTTTHVKLVERIPGDTNGDGRVNVEDINDVVNIILGQSNYTINSDLNDDRVVNVLDLNEMVNIILAQ